MRRRVRWTGRFRSSTRCGRGMASTTMKRRRGLVCTRRCLRVRNSAIGVDRASDEEEEFCETTQPQAIVEEPQCRVWVRGVCRDGDRSGYYCLPQSAGCQTASLCGEGEAGD